MSSSHVYRVTNISSGEERCVEISAVYCMLCLTEHPSRHGSCSVRLRDTFFMLPGALLQTPNNFGITLFHAVVGGNVYPPPPPPTPAVVAKSILQSCRHYSVDLIAKIPILRAANLKTNLFGRHTCIIRYPTHRPIPLSAHPLPAELNCGNRKGQS